MVIRPNTVIIIPIVCLLDIFSFKKNTPMMAINTGAAAIIGDIKDTGDIFKALLKARKPAASRIPAKIIIRRTDVFVFRRFIFFLKINGRLKGRVNSLTAAVTRMALKTKFGIFSRKKNTPQVNMEIRAIVKVLSK